ncbi:MAG: hypothetical protein ACOX2Z_00090 [Minisyncoccales bacterium]
MRNATSELAKLKSTVGELPPQEVIEGGEEVERKTIVGEVEQTKADLDYISIMTGVDL